MLSTPASIRTNVETLELQGVRLPLQNQWVVNRRLLDGLLGDGKVDEWISALIPWPIAKGNWDAESPSFRTSPLSEKADSDVVGKFKETWFATAFSDQWVRIFGIAEENPKPLADLCQKLLLAAAAEPVPERYVGLLEPAMKVFRGLLALCSPLPGICNSGQQDVLYVSDSRKSSVAEDIEKFGRLILRKVNKSDSWRARL